MSSLSRDALAIVEAVLEAIAIPDAAAGSETARLRVLDQRVTALRALLEQIADDPRPERRTDRLEYLADLLRLYPATYEATGGES
jgi:hypothetical protein